MPWDLKYSWAGARRSIGEERRVEDDGDDRGGGGRWLLAQCTAIKADGERCKGVAIGLSEWCYQHAPQHAEERSRNGSKGGRRGGRGRSSPAGELTEVKATLRELTEDVLSGKRDKSIATVANLLLNTRLRAVELERRWRDTQELEGRLEALEGVLKGRTKAR